MLVEKGDPPQAKSPVGTTLNKHYSTALEFYPDASDYRYLPHHSETEVRSRNLSPD